MPAKMNPVVENGILEKRKKLHITEQINVSQNEIKEITEKF